MKHLEKQQKELEICEKALAEYMESKRRAFPRFYFVSSADLLDILSNGNNPIKVMQHMNKCFQVHPPLCLQSVPFRLNRWLLLLFSDPGQTVLLQHSIIGKTGCSKPSVVTNLQLHAVLCYSVPSTTKRLQ